MEKIHVFLYLILLKKFEFKIHNNQVKQDQNWGEIYRGEREKEKCKNFVAYIFFQSFDFFSSDGDGLR